MKKRALEITLVLSDELRVDTFKKYIEDYNSSVEIIEAKERERKNGEG